MLCECPVIDHKCLELRGSGMPTHQGSPPAPKCYFLCWKVPERHGLFAEAASTITVGANLCLKGPGVSISQFPPASDGITLRHVFCIVLVSHVIKHGLLIITLPSLICLLPLRLLSVVLLGLPTNTTCSPGGAQVEYT